MINDSRKIALLARCKVLKNGGREVKEDNDVRPVIFKNGKDFGKVDGIRGCYRDATGRWFVRYSRSGIDRQKTIEVNNNPTFSGLERIASTAIRSLKKEVDAELVKRNPVQQTTVKSPVSVIEKGQMMMISFIKETYASSKKNVTRRLGQLKGFAMTGRNAGKSVEEIDSHNARLMREILEQRKGNQSALEYFKGIHAVFSQAMQAGLHVGLNPATKQNRPGDYCEKDYKSLSIEQLATIYNSIKTNIFNIDNNLIKQCLCFFYLLCTGMRSTSAILFKASDIEQIKVNNKYKYYYRVYNNKRSKKMPYKQLISRHIINELKQIHAFTYSVKTFQNVINKFIKHCYPDSGLCVKHLRKSFINEAVEKGRFDLQTVGLITHLSPLDAGQNVTIVRNYYSRGQRPCDKIMSWFNRSLFNAILKTESRHREHFIVNNLKLQNIILKKKMKKMSKKKMSKNG